MKAMGRGFDIEYYPAPAAVKVYAKRYGLYASFGEFAEHLAKRGHAVTVIEKNERLGGVANWFEAPTDLGTFRFDTEFAWAAELISSGAVDISPLITSTVSVDRADEAFKMAGDRTHSIKVQLDFAADLA